MSRASAACLRSQRRQAAMDNRFVAVMYARRTADGCFKATMVAPGRATPAIRPDQARFQLPPSVAGQAVLARCGWVVMLPVVRREAWSATLLAVDREPCVSTIPSGFFARGVVFILTRPLHLFWATEARGALLLLVATVAAL